MGDHLCHAEAMDPWHREIVELHDFFEAYFLGTIASTDVGRLRLALSDDFTIVNPAGVTSSRDEVEAAIVAAHGHSADLRITISDARLLVDDGDTLVARYVENHELSSGSNHRLSTVVFRRDGGAPNGLRWCTVHETWLAATRE